jgi:methyl-accepting chemotaxis protein
MSQANRSTLRRKFLKQILTVMVILAIVSGAVQLYLVNEQIDYETRSKTELISDSVEQGINQTDLASQSIEHQIDLKMMGYNKFISEQLGNRNVQQITNEELIEIRDKIGVEGITLFARSGDDIVGTKSTDSEEIGFGLKGFGEEIFNSASAILENEVPKDDYATYKDKGILVLPIAQSGARDDVEPVFFKFAYLHPPGTDYYISSYVEANEVFKYTQEVGPNRWIQQLVEEKTIIKEVGVLNPKVFADPSLKEEIYPPLNEITFGSFDLRTKLDEEFLAGKVTKISKVEKINGDKVYKMFVPINEDRTIYIALDYGEIIGPIYKHAIILFISGLLILVAIFLLTAKFFDRIYENIQRIRTQIKLLAAGNFTAKSNVDDNTELGSLSRSANKMVEDLHQVLSDTSEQAFHAQRVSYLLENEANETVEKMYLVSTETTIKQRDIVDEVLSFLDEVEASLQSIETQSAKEAVLKIDRMREVAKSRATTTTDMTLALSDLLKSLQSQSRVISSISQTLMQHISKFKLQ